MRFCGWEDEVVVDDEDDERVIMKVKSKGKKGKKVNEQSKSMRDFSSLTKRDEY